jgi:hypothetical protein
MLHKDMAMHQSEIAKLVIKIGLKRASEASRIASSFGLPCSRSWLANSTIKIPFLVTNNKHNRSNLAKNIPSLIE